MASTIAARAAKRELTFGVTAVIYVGPRGDVNRTPDAPRPFFVPRDRTFLGPVQPRLMPPELAGTMTGRIRVDRETAPMHRLFLDEFGGNRERQAETRR